MLNVDSGVKPMIVRSSVIRNVNVDGDVPMKYLATENNNELEVDVGDHCAQKYTVD